jgi:hypothetical protein
MCFSTRILCVFISTRVSLCTGVQTKMVTFEVSWHGVVGSHWMCEYWKTVYSDRVHKTDSVRIVLWTESTEAPLPNESINGFGSSMKKEMSCVKSDWVSCPQFAHPRALPECWPQSAAISHNHPQALGMSNSCVWCILHCDLNLHPYILQIVHSLSDRAREVCFQFCCQFQSTLTEDPNLPNNHLMTDEACSHVHGTVNKQNLWYRSAAKCYELHQCPFMTQTLQFGVLFGPEESRDPTSYRMKMDQLSQSHHTATQIRSIKF